MCIHREKAYARGRGPCLPWSASPSQQRLTARLSAQQGGKDVIMLSKPIVLAPMAGGPSTPQLAAAVSGAGGLGFLAAGYLTPDDLARQVEQIEQATSRPYGINLFVSSAPHADEREAYRDYRERLAEHLPFSADLPEQPRWSDDHYAPKLEVALASRAALISFTFGYPSAADIAAVSRAGKLVVLNATTPEEIDHIVELGADIVLVQGSGAGGHRATVLSTEERGVAFSAEELTEIAAARTTRPIFAAGGVGTREDVATLLNAHATAVVVGTRFLTAEEAGTKATHRRALLELTDRDTVVTRAFSGRLARAIRNAFTDRFTELAPAMYPEIHYLTSPLRGEANDAGDAEYLNLWAGTGFAQCSEASAAEIVNELGSA
ncbi:NAD(P)H-dependent flavin oxidoreductase [Corynebacterium sanguinis]|uniref:NAD(P)H-dependent flavin oxidoreductase n=1 Tax=Corynebacterium sanguinis TaxID=2594913 RepID=UPI0021B26678|nr:nitronate monooxygenase [Corynebacterium sanguinis]